MQRVYQTLLWLLHQLMDAPCAGMRPGEKTTTFKLSTAQLLLVPCKPQHSAVTELLVSYSEAKGVLQTRVLCIILQGCAAGKALPVEAADLLGC